MYPVDEKISKDNAGSLRHSQLRFKWRARETSHDNTVVGFLRSSPSRRPFRPMELPTSRELELEIAIRERDTQLASLAVSPLVRRPSLARVSIRT